MLLCLLMISASGLILAAYPNLLGTILGGLGLSVFGVALVIQVSKFFYSGSQVIVNSAGIEDRRLKIGLIRWGEISAVSLERTKYAEWLNVNLASPEKYRSRLPRFESFLRRANGQRGKNDFRIRFKELDKSADEVFQFIEYIMETRREENLALAR